MSNTIKLKRGSGSDPSASDLVVGELAIRTDSGKIFTKKDNGSVAEISGGGGIDDGDKGDITISNGGDTFTIDNGVVTSAKIANDAITSDELASNSVNSAHIINGSITNTDINASAAIDGTKINPNFGTQNINTSGSAAVGNITISNVNPKIFFTDTNNDSDFSIKNNNGVFSFTDQTNSADRLTIASNGRATFGNDVGINGNLDVGNGLDVTGDITATGDLSLADKITITGTAPKIVLTDSDHNSDFRINVGGGVFQIEDATNSFADRFTIASDGTTTVAQNLDVGAGLDVTGNITVSGTVDGVDIATRNTLFGGLTSSSGVLTNGVTATTQSAGNNTTRVATTAFVSTAISNLVDSAPGTLNTLNELAAALGDDANFSTTVTNSIATKLPLAGGTLTGGLTGTTAIFSSTSSAPALEAKGDGSSTDGYIQLNCSQNSHGIKLSSPAHSANASYTFTFPTSISSGQFLTTDSSGNTSWATPTDTNTQLSNEQVQDIVGGMVSGNTESGITVTYQDGDGTLDFSVASQTDENFTTTLKNKLDGIAAGATNVTNTNQLTNGAGFITATLTNEQVQDIVGGMVSGNTESGITVTYQDSDGTLDFSVASQTDNNFTTTLKNKLDGIASGATNVTNTNQLTNGAGFITSADGGNAATLDSLDSTAFLRSNADDSGSGLLSLSSGVAFGADAKCTAALSSLTADGGGTITVNFTSGIHHSVTLGANRTLSHSNTANAVGQSGSIFITQDGTGSRTLSFNSAYKFVGGTAPTLSTAANAVDRLDYVIKSSSVIHCVISLDVK